MYWEKSGPENTGRTVAAAVKRAEELGITHIVVASNSGETVRKFPAGKLNLVCVTHQVGFRNPGEDEMPPETRAQLQQMGIKVLTATHLLAGVDRALRFKFQGVYPAEIVASTLRMLGEGVKVCVEVAVMALDAGLIPYGKDIIAVGGTERGADTALIIAPAHSQDLFATRIKEIICKPRA